MMNHMYGISAVRKSLQSRRAKVGARRAVPFVWLAPRRTAKTTKPVLSRSTELTALSLSKGWSKGISASTNTRRRDSSSRKRGTQNDRGGGRYHAGARRWTPQQCRGESRACGIARRQSDAPQKLGGRRGASPLQKRCGHTQRISESHPAH